MKTQPNNDQEPNPPMFSEKWWIPDERLEALKKALVRGQGDFTDTEITQVATWVKKWGWGCFITQLLFEGLVTVKVRNTENQFVFGPVPSENQPKQRTEGLRLSPEDVESILKEFAIQQPGGAPLSGGVREGLEMRQQLNRTTTKPTKKDCSDPDPDEAVIEAHKCLIPDRKLVALCRALSLGQQGTFTTEELGRVVEWVTHAIVSDRLIQGVFKGELAVSTRKDGEPVFGVAESDDGVASEIRCEARRHIRQLPTTVLTEIAKQQGWKGECLGQRLPEAVLATRLDDIRCRLGAVRKVHS